MLRILFDLGSEDSDGGRDVRSGCRQLLDRLLCELQIKVYQRQSAKRGHHYVSTETMPLLTAFGRCYEYFVDSFIFSDDVYLRRCLVTLLIYLAHYQDSGQRAGAVAIGVVRYCLQHAEDEDDLGAMFEFIRDVELAQPEVVNAAVARCLASKEAVVTNLLRNIGKVRKNINCICEQCFDVKQCLFYRLSSTRHSQQKSRRSG